MTRKIEADINARFAASSGAERSQQTRPSLSHQSSFPSGSPSPTPRIGCCAQCGRNTHRARECKESTLRNGRDAIPTEARPDSRGLWSKGARGQEICVRYNIGTCINDRHPQMHICTLCLQRGHGAQTCPSFL
jgi:hypothetical protein